MANIKTTPEQWGRAREYFEAGLSLSKITDKTGISKTQLSKRANLDGWAKGTEKEQLIATAVQVAEAKGTLTEQALDVHEELVDERTKHVLFFNEAAVKNVQAAMKEPCVGQIDFKHRADTISRGREVVLGKAEAPGGPATTVNILTMSTSELELIARGR
jgi:hypothetical protein